MKKELGKWILDVAKYITTAGIIAPFLAKESQDSWRVFLIMMAIVVVMMAIGMFFIKDENVKPIKKKK